MCKLSRHLVHLTAILLMLSCKNSKSPPLEIASDSSNLKGFGFATKLVCNVTETVGGKSQLERTASISFWKGVSRTEKAQAKEAKLVRFKSFIDLAGDSKEAYAFNTAIKGAMVIDPHEIALESSDTTDITLKIQDSENGPVTLSGRIKDKRANFSNEPPRLLDGVCLVLY